jgi:hypothetical protein
MDCEKRIIKFRNQIIPSGRFQSGQMGQTVNLLFYDFGGSNPPLPTLSVGVGVEVICTRTGKHTQLVREKRSLTLTHKPTQYAGVAQLVEHNPSKVRVAGSSLVSRSFLLM